MPEYIVLSTVPMESLEELIRCKNCKYFNGDYKYCDFDICVTSDDFCSNGVDKNDHQG